MQIKMATDQQKGQGDEPPYRRHNFRGALASQVQSGARIFALLLGEDHAEQVPDFVRDTLLAFSILRLCKRLREVLQDELLDFLENGGHLVLVRQSTHNGEVGI